MVGILHALNGMVRLQITVADPAALLYKLQEMNIPLENVACPDMLTLRLTIKRQHLDAVKALTEQKGGQWETLEKTGLYWKFLSFLKRPCLLIGIVFIFILTIFLPTRLLFFRVEGNASVPTRQILAFAAENGLEFGAVRREVRSEKIKNSLLKAIPELEWVGINTAGCVATISVRERQSQTKQPTAFAVSHIVATKNATVSELTVTAGSALVKPGQVVERGQTLISGYTDCGLSIRAERAEGEVFGTTQYHLTLLLPENDTTMGTIFHREEKISLIFGKNRINFFESGGNLDTGCVKMYEEKYLTLPGGFALPIGIAKEQQIFYNAVVATTDTEHILCQAAQRYLQSQMIAGTLLSRDEVISNENGVWCLEGDYVCREMIGKEQSEEIIKP